MKKNICVLGSTGSIGTQTLEVAKNLGIKVSSLAVNQNIDLLEKQIRMFKPQVAAVFNDAQALKLKKRVNDTFTKILSGKEGVCEAATVSSAETVVAAMSGISGLLPTVEAIKTGKDIALANKETLVAGGSLVIKLAKEKNVKLFPVDSEHSAIFQCLQGNKNKKNIQKLILTASGGPFFGKTLSELKTVSAEEALNHPNWNMGKKISIDSATMMNKGLEIIEAAHLFEVPVENIDVVIHRESIVHSMVEFNDGAVLAQMAVPSMKIPIQYALTYPERVNCSVEGLNLAKFKNLSFFDPDYKAFKAIDICKKAFNKNDSACVVINAANEKAVEMFLNREILFTDIVKIVDYALDHFDFPALKSFEEIEIIDKKVKDKIEMINKNIE